LRKKKGKRPLRFGGVYCLVDAYVDKKKEKPKNPEGALTMNQFKKKNPTEDEEKSLRGEKGPRGIIVEIYYG